MSLTEQEILRYSRHIILPEVGGRGQKRLKAASVLVAGLGPSGSAAALYLAAAGIGRITLWDPGLVTAADLSAAIAHDQRRIGLERVRSAYEPLAAINPDAAITTLDRESDPAAAAAGHQILVASAGDWSALQRAAVQHEVSAVFAATHGASGAVMVYKPGGPCLDCIPAEKRTACALGPEGEEGAVGAAAGVIGVAAATEAVKLILGIGSALTDRMLCFDGWEARFRESPIARDHECGTCRVK